MMKVLKIILSGYFHEDHLEGIINPKFQLSIISGWRDIGDFKLHKIQTNQDFTDQNLNPLYFRLVLCYSGKTFRNLRVDCTFCDE